MVAVVLRKADYGSFCDNAEAGFVELKGALLTPQELLNLSEAGCPGRTTADEIESAES